MVALLIILLLALSCVSCSQESSGLEKYVKQYRASSSIDLAAYAQAYPEAGYDSLLLADVSALEGRSVAFLGGSLAYNEEADVAKAIYNEVLHCSPILTYAHGGYGYATSGGSVQDFIPILGNHDIYILWCSTNDYGMGIPADSMCAGIGKCVDAIRDINPQALIVGFNSLRFFGVDGSREDGYLDDTTKNNGQGITYRDYVGREDDFFEEEGIPCFDQYNCGLFNIDNYSSFYLSDGFHLNCDGYFLLGCRQARFLIDLFN